MNLASPRLRLFNSIRKRVRVRILINEKETDQCKHTVCNATRLRNRLRYKYAPRLSQQSAAPKSIAARKSILKVVGYIKRTINVPGEWLSRIRLQSINYELKSFCSCEGLAPQFHSGGFLELLEAGVKKLLNGLRIIHVHELRASLIRRPLHWESALRSKCKYEISR